MTDTNARFEGSIPEVYLEIACGTGVVTMPGACSMPSHTPALCENGVSRASRAS